MSNLPPSFAGERPADGPAPARRGRHGLCGACGRTFLLEGGAVPAEGLVLDCPVCGAPVPLSASPRRRRSYRILSRPLQEASAPSPADEAPASRPARSAPEGTPAAISLQTEETLAAPAARPPVRRRARVVPLAPPRRRGWIGPLAGLLLGLGAGAGLPAFLAVRAGELSLETLLGLPLWAKEVAGALPVLGLGLGLLLRRRR